MNNRATEIINRMINKSQVTEADSKELDALKAILDGKSKEYYTDIMVETLMRYVDFASMEDDDFDELTTMFFNTPNLKKPNRADIDASYV